MSAKKIEGSKRKEQEPEQRSVKRSTQIEKAISLLESNPAVSADVVKTIKDLYSNSNSAEQGSDGSYQSDDSDQAGDDQDMHTSMSKILQQPSSRNTLPAVQEASSAVCDGNKRLHLTEDQVIEIYNLRPQHARQGRLRRGSMLRCKTIAPRYGVTPKTIRDIWCGRTWPQTTEHLWTDEERAARQSFRKPEILTGQDVKRALEDLRVSFLGNPGSSSASSRSATAVAEPEVRSSKSPCSLNRKPSNSGWEGLSSLALAALEPSTPHAELSRREPRTSSSSKAVKAQEKGEDSPMESPRHSPAPVSSSEWLSRLVGNATAGGALSKTLRSMQDSATASSSRAGAQSVALGKSSRAQVPLNEADSASNAASSDAMMMNDVAPSRYAVKPMIRDHPCEASGKSHGPVLAPLRLGSPLSAMRAAASQRAGGQLPPSAESPGLAGALTLLGALYPGGEGGAASGGVLSPQQDGFLSSLRDVVQRSLSWTPDVPGFKVHTADLGVAADASSSRPSTAADVVAARGGLCSVLGGSGAAAAAAPTAAPSSQGAASAMLPPLRYVAQVKADTWSREGL